jgi:hypothetical protein
VSSRQDERFLNYSLAGLLPQESRFVLDAELHVFSQLAPLSENCTIVEQQQLTAVEFDILSTVLSQHPYYCPLVNLLAAYRHSSVERCLPLLTRALEEGELEYVMRPVRGLVSRVRAKLRPFGLDIRSMLETGYMLLPDDKPVRQNGGRRS